VEAPGSKGGWDERHLAAIVESSNDAIIGKLLDGTITSWNPAAERLYGYTPEQAVGQPVAMLEPEDRRGEVAGFLERLARGERIASYETVRLHKNGSRVDVVLTIAPIYDLDGSIEGSATIAHDLRERRLVEEELRRSRESYRDLFRGHPAPMWVFEPDSLRFLAVNDAAIQVYGYSREEFLAMTIADIRPAGDVVALADALADAGRGHVELSVWRHRKKDGSLIDVAISSDTIRFNDQQARVVLARDVTEQRRLEEQLRQTQKMEAIGRLAGGISHDFNNLLLVIRGYAQSLLETLDSDELEAVRQIDVAAERAAGLTHQLLAFSRQQVMKLEVADPNVVVLDTLRLLHRTIGDEVEVETDLETGVSSIMVDRSQLTQAVLNLAINARDAMPDGGRLHIHTAEVSLDDSHMARREEITPGRYVLLQITDSGTGMDEETQRHAFDPFYTTKGDGTGLGLATVYGIVKQSGGHIWFYSEVGAGTSFKLYFPVAERAARPRQVEVPAENLGGHETILVVEDADIVRELVKTMLEDYGYEVLTAASGGEALAVAARLNGKFDLVITDVVMRGMNGRELVEALAVRYPALKLLYTSGYPADTIVRHGIADARAAFIEKPYLPQELARKVREVLDGP
jgi:hypothetical protein